MKKIVRLLFILLFISCSADVTDNSSNTENYPEYQEDTVFSNLYRTSPLFNQDFRVFLDKIDSLPFQMKQQFAIEFLTNLEKIPIIESDTIVHFIYWGKAESVAVAGDATDWAPRQFLKHIEGTDFWYATATYPSETRIEYKIVVDSSNWKLDSLNKQQVLGGMGMNSELILPDYLFPFYSNDIDSIPQGNYFDKFLQSSYLKEKRKYRVYLPPGYDSSSATYPLIMFHDGIQFFDMTASFHIFNNLIFENKIQPFIAVFIDPVQRDEEYSGSLQENYTNFIVNELLPYLDSSFRTVTEATSRAQGGISNGGNIALWVVARHPESFAKVAALSSNVEDKINTEFEKNRSANFKIYLLKSKYELPILIPRINRLEKTISKINCEALICEYPEGHNWAFWQKHLPEALQYLFPPTEN